MRCNPTTQTCDVTGREDENKARKPAASRKGNHDDDHLRWNPDQGTVRFSARRGSADCGDDQFPSDDRCYAQHLQFPNFGPKTPCSADQSTKLHCRKLPPETKASTIDLHTHSVGSAPELGVFWCERAVACHL